MTRLTQGYPAIVLHQCAECATLVIGYPNIFGNYYCERHKGK